MAYRDLLKEENTHEVYCEVDFHFQTLYQKYTIYGKRIKLCASRAAVVYLTFCQQAAHFLVTSRSIISICSTFVNVTFYLLVAFYLQVTWIHAHI